MAIKTFTAGSVLTASDTNTYLANSGLVYVASATATSGSSLAISSCFSTTYDSYRVVLNDIRLNSPAWVYLQFTGTTSNYWYGRLEIPYNSAASLGRGGSGTVASSNWEIAVSGTSSNGAVVDIHNPFLARQTSYSAQGTDPRSGGTFGQLLVAGIQTDSTSFTGLTLSTGVTITNLTATIYGYRKA